MQKFDVLSIHECFIVVEKKGGGVLEYGIAKYLPNDIDKASINRVEFNGLAKQIHTHPTTFMNNSIKATSVLYTLKN